MESDTAAASAPASEPEAIKPKSFFNRLWGTIFAPGVTFKEIGGSPAVLVPIIALVLLGLLQGFYMTTHFDMESMLTGMAAAQGQTQGQMTAEQKERSEQSMAFILKFINVFMIVTSCVSGLIFALILAGIAKLISKFVGAENRFKPLFCVTVYAVFVVYIASFALLALIASLKDPGELTYANMRSMVTSNLGAILGSFFGENVLPKFLMKLLEYVDVFAIWGISLTSIGYAAVSRKLKAGTIAIWFSGIYGILALIGATFGTIFSPK